MREDIVRVNFIYREFFVTSFAAKRRENYTPLGCMGIVVLVPPRLKKNTNFYYFFIINVA